MRGWATAASSRRAQVPAILATLVASVTLIIVTSTLTALHIVRPRRVRAASSPGSARPLVVRRQAPRARRYAVIRGGRGEHRRTGP